MGEVDPNSSISKINKKEEMREVPKSCLIGLGSSYFDESPPSSKSKLLSKNNQYIYYAMNKDARQSVDNSIEIALT